MNTKDKSRILGTLSVPIGLFLIFIPYVLIVGNSFETSIIFWFIIAPVSIIFFPRLISKNQDHFFESLFGLMLFYGLMVFMI